jgi:hypothetical protein
MGLTHAYAPAVGAFWAAGAAWLFMVFGMDTKLWNTAFSSDKKGSFETREAGRKTIEHLHRFVEQKKWKGVTPETISPKQLRFFVEARLEKVSPRVVQNEVSHIRRCLQGAGRELGTIRDPKNSWSAERLSLPTRIERGTHRAAVSLQARTRLDELKPDVRAVVDLQGAMGLRIKEAVMAHHSFSDWSRTLNLCKHGEDVRLNVSHGTKGGRHRDVLIRAETVQNVREAIENAIVQVEKNAEQKIIGIVARDDLKDAIQRVTSGLAYRGFRGTDSSHGFRREWAQAQFVGYRERGLSEDEAKFRLAADLGHGRTDIIGPHYLSGGEG